MFVYRRRFELFNLHLLFWEVEKCERHIQKNTHPIPLMPLHHINHHQRNETSINWPKIYAPFASYLCLDWGDDERKKCYISKWYCGLPFSAITKEPQRFLRKRSPRYFCCFVRRSSCLMNNDPGSHRSRTQHLPVVDSFFCSQREDL